MKIGIITQARMTSTRLPGKILMEAAGITMLEHHVRRLQSSNIKVIVATTVNETDDVVTTLCETLEVPFSRGSEDDVLGRYHHCAEAHSLDVVVRVTSDCPLIDASLIEEGVRVFLADREPYLYVSSVLQKTFPHGTEFEVFNAAYLEEAFEKAEGRVFREHVTPYINRNVSGRTVFRHMTQQNDTSRFRITLDEQADYTLLKLLIEEYGAADLSHGEIATLLSEHPELVAINASVQAKKA